jgi:hypothetical protein
MIAELTLEDPKINHSVTSICKNFIDEKLREYQKGQTDDRTDLDVVA